eukprot:scaffold20889_cov25-Cyclotella_meneghiniana.AAC.1
MPTQFDNSTDHYVDPLRLRIIKKARRNEPQGTMISVSNIKRVVSVFILRPNENNPTIKWDVAVFRRCSTMPTFPNHWAGISGSIEDDDDSPLEAAAREVSEETNLYEYELTMKGDDNSNHPSRRLLLQSYMKAGLYLDINKSTTKGAFGGRVIRVYPFALTLEDSGCNNVIEMRGTEHDAMKFVSIDEFLRLAPCVPELQRAFHHATAGAYLKLPEDIRTWENDRVNGASYLARKAIELAVGAPHLSTYSQFEENNLCNSHPNTMAKSIAILRPSMVPIVNVMNEFDKRTLESLETSEIGTIQIDLLKALDLEVEECINLAVETIIKDYESWHSTASSNIFVIGTFSRSSTLVSILKRVLQSMQNAFTDTSIRVVCSQSTPGDEGELMANDIPGATCLSDKQFEEHIRE